MRAPRVVIVGAGFGGLACARELAQLVINVPLGPGEEHPDTCGHDHGASAGDADGSARHAHVHAQITVVDQRNFHTFLPLLYQVATAGLNSADVAYPVRGILRRLPHVQFRQARVAGIDWEAREVRLVDPSSGEADGVLEFDHVVVAAGAEVHWFGVGGADEHAFPLYTLQDAVVVRNHVLARFEAASADPSLVDDGALTVVVVGGGPTGVETAGALCELFEGVLRRDFPALDIGRARVVLVERADTLLGAFSPRSRAHALDTLRERGVEVRLGTSVEAVSATRVTLAGGEELRAHTVVWAAGVKAGGLAEVIDVAQGAGGRIEVGADFSIVGRAGGWAIGDVAQFATSEGPLPQLAQVAIQGGVHVARSIAETVAGAPTQPFTYRNRGIMATIGRRAAVAELPHVPALRGGVAWLAWLGLHLVTLLGMRNRISVLVNWSWNYLTWDRGPRIIFGPEAPESSTPPVGERP